MTNSAPIAAHHITLSIQIRNLHPSSNLQEYYTFRGLLPPESIQEIVTEIGPFSDQILQNYLNHFMIEVIEAQPYTEPNGSL